MKVSAPRMVTDGLAFPESLRWHEQSLWFSDVLGGSVHRIDGGDGQPRLVLGVHPSPAGLGWLPSDDLVVVDAVNRRLLRVQDDGTVDLFADLTALFSHPANELLTDPAGGFWVGSYGFDPESDPASSSPLLRVSVDGTVTATVNGLIFPNGMAWLGPDQFVVAETFADRLAVVSVDPVGGASLTHRIDLPGGATPDGLDVDEDGGIWVASAYGAAILHIAPNGAMTRAVELPDRGVFDCSFGGADGSVLFIAVSDTDETDAATRRPGAILSVQTETRGVHWAGE